jgi:CubicO group peptidase (beta-lactamase class C family)
MDTPLVDHPHESFAGHHLTRRQALLGAAAGALAAVPAAVAARQGDATPAATPIPAAALTDDLLRSFTADVEAALVTFKVPGASVALVQKDQIVFARGFGVRDLASRAPVTEHTRFRIASNTKSMTSLLVAQFVDDGVLGWDDRVVDVWPAFRAPTPELTQGLRVRDLLGNGTGLAESTTVEFFMMAGGDSALDLLRAVADQAVIAPPNTAYAYNNTLFCVAGYLGPLVQRTAPDALVPRYAALVEQQIFAPIGMADAAIADDPRPLGDDYAVGSTRDLFGRPSAAPFVAIDGVAPAGAGLASATDMARYLVTQMNGGVAPDGTRIVSAANLAETHRPGIAVPPDALNALPAVVLPDTTAMHYCLGWFEQVFKDGRRLLWHAGGIDGFASLMGFFPAEQLGFVVLTNLEPGAGGALFNIFVQSSLLGRLFSLNQTLPAFLASVVPVLEQRTADLAVRTRPVDPTALTPYLGLYTQGFRVRLDEAGVLRLEHDIRSLPLLAVPDGTYVVADGPAAVLAKTVTFTTSASGVRTMTIGGFGPVRWLTAD